MEWNVEEMKLLNEKCNMYFGKEKIYQCESINRQEKIDFIDKFNDGKMSYLLALINKFEADKESLPKDDWNNVKTVSLKAWLKKNDNLKIIDDNYHYGKLRFLNTERWISDANRKRSYDTYENIVDECFHRVLIKCEREEEKYFLEHDEYSILKKRLAEQSNKYNTAFGVLVSTWSSGKVCVCDDNGDERDITIDELKLLLSKYEELDRVVEKITNEISIKY